MKSFISGKDHGHKDRDVEPLRDSLKPHLSSKCCTQQKVKLRRLREDTLPSCQLPPAVESLFQRAELWFEPPPVHIVVGATLAPFVTVRWDESALRNIARSWAKNGVFFVASQLYRPRLWEE